ncbi:hypothetical protein K5D51_08750, partial [Pseudomonas cichorii]|nr:hypothetical protein [Pseudomonas cichorii]
LARDRVRSARKIYDCCAAGRGQARSYNAACSILFDESEFIREDIIEGYTFSSGVRASRE